MEGTSKHVSVYWQPGTNYEQIASFAWCKIRTRVPESKTVPPPVAVSFVLTTRAWSIRQKRTGITHPAQKRADSVQKRFPTACLYLALVYKFHCCAKEAGEHDLCAGSRVNTKYERIASCAGWCQLRTQALQSQKSSPTTVSSILITRP